jgi:tRNA G46 methylase TrmB
MHELTHLSRSDNWAHSSLVALCHGLTMHEFTVPPKRVLDIGCGSGLWILDAAQQWPVSDLFSSFTVFTWTWLV